MTKSSLFTARAPLSRLRTLIPALTGAEKTALVALTLTLTTGGALRLWEHSGVRIGPVDDWASLRALVIRARAPSSMPATQTQGTQESDYPCLDEHAAGGFGNHRGSGPVGGGVMVTAGFGSSQNAVAGKRESASGKKRPARAVDLNTAGERALLTLPGVGPSTARAIIAHRAAAGGFRSVDDLLQVKGIGPKKLEALRPYAIVAPVGVKGEPKSGPKADKADGPPATDTGT
jgi:comEA protein